VGASHPYSISSNTPAAARLVIIHFFNIFHGMFALVYSRGSPLFAWS
jgi:hypothetical protein